MSVREGRAEVHDFHDLDARTRDISLLPLHFLRLIERGETVEVKHDYSLRFLSISHLELVSMVHIYFTMQYTQTPSHGDPLCDFP